MRSSAEFGHCTQVAFLFGRKAIKPNPKKAGIKFGSCDRPCGGDVVGSNRGAGSNIPSVLSPFLKKIGVALSIADDGFDRVEINTLIFALNSRTSRRYDARFSRQ